MNLVNMMGWSKMKVYCPYCKKEENYKIEKRELKEFRGVEINTYENVAMCEKCNNDLYVNEIENENNERIYDVYRDKTNIIKPQDIIDLRTKYDISQRELTSILGFGKMTINRYERGGIPTKSQSDYIKLLIENENEFIKKTKEAYKKNNISQKTYEKIVSKDMKNEVSQNDIQEMYRLYINNVLRKNPDIYNGYKLFDLELVENIISYIASKVKNLTITSVNKYLWFIDILSFNKRGVSITGLTYQNQQFGPTIIEQKYKEISLLDAKYTRNDYEDETGTKTYIISNKNYDLSKLDNSEIDIINTIIKLLKDKNVTDISNMSHKEEGWKKTKRFENISFEYAMNLNIIK
ncbi:MAG TPA: XRE family transcriptional regulator [Clostridiales bacterium]|nr:XRE family transcriptional regulator [Clostridiales bacterium]